MFLDFLPSVSLLGPLTENPDTKFVLYHKTVELFHFKEIKWNIMITLELTVGRWHA